MDTFRTFIFLTLLLVGFSCAKYVPDNNDVSESFDDDPGLIGANTENVLLQQILHGYHCEAVLSDSIKYRFSKDDMIALGDVVADEMVKMGLKLNPELFASQALKTHGVKVTKPCHFSLYEKRMLMFLVPDLYKPEPEYDFSIDLTASHFYAIEDVVFDPRVGLLYPALYLPEVIDYEERFPEIKKAENLAVMPKVNGEKVLKWSEEPTLKMFREETLNMIYHINNYVLYESKESLDWLVNNCMPVLQAMFVDFNMEHDPVIDSLVLVRTRSGESRLESLFAERNADGSVYVREGLLEYIKDNEKYKSPRFKNIIRQYVAGCFGHDVYYDRLKRFPDVLEETFTLEERRMIVAKILKVVFPVYSGTDTDKIMKIICEHDPDFIENTVKKNYYGSEEIRRGISIYRMRFRAEKWKVLTPESRAS